MTVVSASPAHRGRGRGYAFSQVARMEWIKLRSLRYPKWALAITAAAMIAIGVANAHGAAAHPGPGFDPTQNAFAGLVIAQLVAGIVGVLVMTGEYSSGLIRATLAAIPDRRLVLAAKAAVLGTVILALGEVVAFGTFFAMRLALPASVPHPGLGQPGVLRAVIMAGLYLGLVALIGIGLGAIIRHTVAAIGTLAGLLFALPLLLLALPHSMGNAAEKFLPMIIAENSLVAVVPTSPALPVWAAFGMLCLYAAVLLGAGGWLLGWRDA